MYTNRAMYMAATGKIKYGRMSYEDELKPPTYFGSKLASALEHPIADWPATLAPVEPSVERVAEEVKKSAESSKAKDVEDAVYGLRHPKTLTHTRWPETLRRNKSTAEPQPSVNS